jgi:hypothetical protein
MTTNGRSSDVFRAKMAAELGLDASASDEAIVSAAKALRMRSMIAAAAGVSPSVDDDTLASAVRARRDLVEASKRRVDEVRLQAADRSAIDATVAAADFRGGTLRGGGTNPPPPPPRAAVDKHGFPVLDMPAPVRISEGKPPETWTKEEQYRYLAHQLGGKFALGVPRPPRGEDGYYWPSPDDHSELVNGEWVEKNPYREI